MKFLCFVFIIGFFAQISWAESNCDLIRKDLIKYFTEKSMIRDISKDVTKTADACKIDVVKEVPKELLQSMKSRGYESQYNVYRDRMKSYAAYGAFSNTDYNRAIYYADLAKKNKNEIELLRKKSDQVKSGTENCSSVDLRPKMGPVRDQDSSGWCYAFTASDLISFKIGKRISAASLAVQFNNDRNPWWRRIFSGPESSMSGGQPNKATEIGLEKGLCLEEDFPSEYSGNGEFGAKDLHDYMQKLEEETNRKERAQLQKAIFMSALPMGTAWKLADFLCFNCTKSQPQPVISVSQQGNAQDLADVIERSNVNNVFRKLEKKMCDGKRIQIPNLKIHYAQEDEEKSIESRKSLIGMLDAQLDKKEPAGISYYFSFLSREDGGREYPHASVVVGRQINPATKRCEYLIRNSWGKKCSGVGNKRMACDSSDGHIWISREDLHSVIYTFTALE